MIISNQFPNTTEKIKISYHSDERFSKSVKIVLAVYSFYNNSSLPVAAQIELINNIQDKSWSCELLLNDSVNFCILKVIGYLISQQKEDITSQARKYNPIKENYSYKNDTKPDFIIDDNYSEYWVIYPKKDGKALRNTYLNATASYLGTFPENFRRNIDYGKAIECLEKEVQNYPDNIQAAIGLNTLMYDTKKLTESQFKKNISDILVKFDEKSLKDIHENELKAIVRGFNILNKSNFADKIEKRYAELHPSSELAEQAQLEKLKTIKSMKDFTINVSDFLRKFPNYQNMDRIYYSIIEAYLQSGKLSELLAFLDPLPNVEPNIYLQISSTLLNKKSLEKFISRDERAGYASMLIKNMIDPIFDDDEFEYNVRNKPQYVSHIEWRQERLKIKAKMAEICGDLYRTIDSTLLDKSLGYYEKAFTILYGNTDGDLYFKLISSYNDKEEYAAAYAYASLAISDSKESPEILELHKELFKKIQPDSSQWNTFSEKLAYIQNEAEKSRFNLLKYKAIQSKSMSGNYSSLDGRIYDFYDLKNKTSVILFWSSWCEPCKAVYPVYEDLFNKYKDSSDIALISINVWEQKDNKSETIEKFLKDAQPDFPVFLDDIDILPYKAGITGLPSMIFLDKAGNIKFIEVGITDDYQLTRDIEDRIMYLNNNTNSK